MNAGPTWVRAKRSIPLSGEVIFSDAADVVSARRWCWRQSRESAATHETAECIVTVEGHHEAAAEDVAAALEDLASALRHHAQADIQQLKVLGATDPRLD